ncbi:OB-fold-containig protein [Dysgonomonas sp. 511]|uniref:OB-fold-containig protein n=1 Tax=Dysgonomonas sp. 511 TaxID=2302930 RepID=UPI0013D1BCDE|nr:OB-fold-containig protein [Dysgonomonas sp. 511]NDV78230.1 DUF1449 family protein [Dysgonomonas sp. 511]
MTELLHSLTHPVSNAVMTAVMGVITIYWLIAMIGGLGFDALDFDVEADVDVDADMDIDGDVASGGAGPFFELLSFVNVGKVPFMFVVTMLIFFMWIGSLITTSLFNMASWGAWSLLILIPIAIISIFITKVATQPFVKIFKAMGYKGEEEIDFLGRSGRMLSTIRDKKVGVAEVLVDANPMKINVVSIDGQEIKYGDSVIIADESDDKRIYYVSKELSIDNF